MGWGWWAGALADAGAGAPMPVDASPTPPRDSEGWATYRLLCFGCCAAGAPGGPAMGRP